MVGKVVGYDDFGNSIHIVHMRNLNMEERKAYVKRLWQEDPKKYYEWKEMCIELDQLPDFFGTHDNPIPIDESKL